MKLREITEDEIQAITTLFQRAENIGSGVYTEENIRELITIIWENTPPVRAKDVDVYWMIDFMKRMRDHSEEVFRLSFENDAAYANPKYVALMTRDVLGVFDFVSIKDDLLTVSQDGEELVFKKADVLEIVFTDNYKYANMQIEGMFEDSCNKQTKSELKKGLK